MADNRTAYLNLTLPDPINQLEEDVVRLISAFNGIDSKIASIDTLLASNDPSLNTVQEMVDAIKANIAEIASINTSIFNLSATKADDATVTAALALKADVSYIDSLLAQTASDAHNELFASLPERYSSPDTGGISISAGDYEHELRMVAEYGIYCYLPSDTTIADGEFVVEPTSGPGRWVLIAPHWDFVWSYLSGIFDDHQNQIDSNVANIEANDGDISTLQADLSTLQSDVALLETTQQTFHGKFLSASSALDFAAINAGTSGTQTITVTGAIVGDAVFVTPPSNLPNGLVPNAYVSADGTVTIRLNNVTASSIDPVSATWKVTVIKI